jgi:hypothetical protein
MTAWSSRTGTTRWTPDSPRSTAAAGTHPAPVFDRAAGISTQTARRPFANWYLGGR